MLKSKLQKREGALARLEYPLLSADERMKMDRGREKPGPARTPEQKQEEAARLRSLIASKGR